MKKLVLVIAIACLVIGAAFAQNWGNASQIISVSGTLQLQSGVIAVASGNNTYLVPSLTQYIGFIEGLREGAQISIDGFASGNYIQPTKVTINGKVYDFPANAPQGMVYGGWGCNNAGNGRGGWGRQINNWGRWGCW